MRVKQGADVGELDTALSGIDEEDEETVDLAEMARKAASSQVIFVVQDIRSERITGTWAFTDLHMVQKLVGDIDYDRPTLTHHIRVEAVSANMATYTWEADEPFVQEGSTPGQLLYGFDEDDVLVDVLADYTPPPRAACAEEDEAEEMISMTVP